ncbi:MAG TPA: glycosyltransferase [Lachnospiraceae bacterium]|nr:glycosyltransferase [Lachnospiraceae bacterium]
MLLSRANIQKTKNYFKKNGMKDTILALQERLSNRKMEKYAYALPTDEELEAQRKHVFERPLFLSVIVPAYETKPVFMQDLILSVMDQTYQKFELIIADASKSDQVQRVVKDYQEQYEGIRYVRLESNGGISDNSNAALEYVTGDYVGLLDHDDLLTPDALYHVMDAIMQCRKKTGSPVLIYSDEDKTNAYLEKFYEPNIKDELNQDLIMTNNYICHLSFFRKDAIKELGFRKEYDGAQDYDLILRTLLWTEQKYQGEDWSERIYHIPKVLYHWRCHEESTAQNPESKQYAYEAGRRAVEAYLLSRGYAAKVSHLKHLGFYRVEYGENVFDVRKDLGAIGGPIYYGNYISGGAMDASGNCLFEGLRKGFSGYMHRAVLQQGVDAIDIRNMKIREDLIPLFEKTTGYSYPFIRKEEWSDEEIGKIRKKSISFCNKLRAKNIAILYDPMLQIGEEDS